MSDKTIDEVPSELSEEKETIYIEEVYRPFGGATSMVGALDYLGEQERTRQISDLEWMFQQIVKNILDTDFDFTEKASLISDAALELASEIRTVSTKSLLVKIKDTLFAGNSPSKPKVSTGFGLHRSKSNGRLMWWGTVSNNYRDREDEILTKEAHQRYVKYFDESGLRPELLLWHTKNAAMGVTTWARELDGFLLMGGEIYPECESTALLAVDKGWEAMSHGFIPLVVDKKEKLVHEYLIFEVSQLPKKYAANEWTTIDVMKDEDSMKSRREHLVELLGEDVVTGMEDRTHSLREALDEEGLESKDTETEEEEVVEEVVEEVSEEEIEPEEVAEPDPDLPSPEDVKMTKEVDDIAEAVVKALDLEGLDTFIKSSFEAQDTKIDALASVIAEMLKSDNEKLDKRVADVFDKTSRFAWQKRASDGVDNVIDDDSELLQDPPKKDGVKDENVLNLFTDFLEN